MNPASGPRRHLRRLPLAIALAVLALGLAAACAGGEDDAGDGDGTSPPATASPTDGSDPTPSPTGAVNNCEPGDGPPQVGEGPDDLEGKITYVRLIFGCSPDIYIMDANGDNSRVLADDPTIDDESDLSPDGTKVVFFSRRSGPALLYTVNADGTGLQQLSPDSGGGDVSPRWSPDGERIAYSHGSSIMVMNADGTERRTVMQSLPPSTEEPCRIGAIVGGWSPEGERIVYYSAIVTSEGNTFWICAVDVDDGDVEVLVSEPEGGLHAEPHWSPDGTKIAFRDDRDSPETCRSGGGGCNYDIFVLDLETGAETNISNNPAFDIEPVWSPDGEWILFASNRDDPNFDLYIMRPDGSDVQRILNDPDSKDSYPSWR